MADYSEEEQIERLQAWWSENGTWLVLSVVLGVAALLGWRHWTSWQQEQSMAASVMYEEMLAAVELAQQSAMSEGQAAIAEARANSLIEQFPDVAYADFARMLLARLAVEDGELDEAQQLLGDVTASPASDMIGFTANLRLARVKAEAGDADGALALLAGNFPEAFKPQALEIKGDVLRRQGDLEGARAAYSAALEAMTDDQFRQLIQMKMDDLVAAP